MALSDFSLGASDPSNPNSIVLTPTQQQLKLAAALQQMKSGADSSPIQSPWQGAARLADGLMGGLAIGQAEKAQADGAKGAGALAADALMKQFALGGGGAAATPAGTPSVSGGPIADGGAIPGASSPVAANTFSGPASIAPYANAIAKVESAGSGDYNAEGPVLKSGDHAFGRYQVMGANVPQWTKDALGKALTPEQFLADPNAQDAVFAKQFGNSVQKYGNPNDAASVWFSGKPLAQAGANVSDGYSTNGQYQDKFSRALAQQLALSGGAAPAGGAQPPAMPYAPPSVPVGALGGGAPAQVASLDPSFVPSPGGVGTGAVPLPPPRPADLGAAPASAPVQVAANGGGVPASPAIAVPGYSGQFTRAQANDGEGVPSQADWDAAQAGAARGGQQVAGGPSGAPQPQAAPSPSAAPQNQAALAAWAKVLQNPYSTPAMQQIAASMIQAAAKPKDPIHVGDSLVDPTTYKTLYSAPAKADATPTSVREFEYGKTHPDFVAQQQQLAAKAEGNHVVAPGAVLLDPKGNVLFQNKGADMSAPETQQTVDFLARRVLAGDPQALTNIGRGAQGGEMVRAVQSRVAEIAKEQGLDPKTILGNQADFSGHKAEQRALGSQNARVTASATEAKGAAQMALDAMDAVPRSNFVPANKIWQMGESALSDPNLKSAQLALMTLKNTYARAINPNGTPHQGDKEHFDQLMSTADGPEATHAAIGQILREVEMAQQSPAKAMKILQNIRAGKSALDGVEEGFGSSTAAPTAAPQVGVPAAGGATHIWTPNGGLQKVQP